ncbi:hypothetical protein CEXT_812261 [Caerostris extrusa]|uniref:Uncharacterized protein n=1 Tax=Caerostris extrusa TaxID=172846 RepID=A0AAV4PKZ6_CAEEX|nr:hypothetical protein CEXT_812261 [Caerostris extrusa]
MRQWQPENCDLTSKNLRKSPSALALTSDRLQRFKLLGSQIIGEVRSMFYHPATFVQNYDQAISYIMYDYYTLSALDNRYYTNYFQKFPNF